MMLSILAQAPAAYAEGEELPAMAAQEDPLAVEDGRGDGAEAAGEPGTDDEQTQEEAAPQDGETPQEDGQPEEEALPQEDALPDEDPLTGEDALAEAEALAEQPTGAVEVTVLQGLPMASTALSVTVENAEGDTVEQAPLTLPADGSETLRLGSLPAGLYTLTVSGGGFATYTQQIEVGDLVSAVQLCAGPLQTEAFAADKPHPGVLRIGDVDGNGKVEQADVDLLVDHMDGDGTGNLDGSGIVDLVDLQMLAASLDDAGEVQSTVSTSIPEDMISAQPVEGTEVTAGDLDALLAGGGSVKLEAKGEGEISEENPVLIDFEFTQSDKESVEMGGLVLQTLPPEQPASVTGATILVEDEEGKTHEFTVEAPATADAPALFALFSAKGATVQPDGSIVVDFGGQIAVKKVTIKITATSDSKNLAEISKVEFVNNMEERIPAPKMNIPEKLTAEPGNRSFTLRWDAQTNVTGYEVKITGPARDGEPAPTETLRAGVNSLAVSSFGGQKLENGVTYTVQVQSCNGAWRSGYSEPVKVTPRADKLPAAPDGLTLTGRYRRIEAHWKNMDDADTYNLYYRVQGQGDFTCVEGISGASYAIQGLQDDTAYEVYVTGVNQLGEGPASLTSVARTVNVSPVKLPEYKLINTTDELGGNTTHIKSMAHGNRGYMMGSPQDEKPTAWGVVDNDYTSWYQIDDWDDGVAYPKNETSGGVRITFDQKYDIGRIALAQAEDYGNYDGVRVYTKGADGKEQEISNVRIARRSDGSRNYYVITIPGGVETDYLRVCVKQGYSARRLITIAEMRFYTYDSLEDEILDLYADDLHLTLRDDVDEAMIQELQAQLDAWGNGEKHPNYDALKWELDNARELLHQKLQPVIDVHTSIMAANDGGLNITGLNAWQPLGVTAQAGDEILIYVGSNTGSNGAKAALQLVATQYHAESGELTATPIDLKVGRNVIPIQQIGSTDTERGGPLYVQYTGKNANDRYSVRVGGGTQIPTLDLYQITNENDRKARVEAYVQELTEYAAGLEKLHTELHASEKGYDEKNCVLNTTDILLDQMMYSVPVTQLLAGLDDGGAEKLLHALDAMDQMMELFYQHKGLTNLEGAGTANHLPAQHLNVRYMRMFSGAFMYAAGNHIGIEWGSVSGLTNGVPVASDENGAYQNGTYFGWGIAHEIGHNINDRRYAVAEVTNNYFAQLSQATNGSVRFDYQNVYDKVTSGTTGPDANVFTQLAMYWQLHLAYDKDYGYKLYNDYNDLLNGRFFARVDTYARTPSKAPAPGGVGLTLGDDAGQNFMRLASAAAEKDLTDFFGRWGMTPDATTAAFMAQYEPEERALYYGNDASRDYRFTHNEAASFKGQDVVTDATTAKINEKMPNQVDLKLASNAEDGLLLGYEIARVTCENGQRHSQVVGFATGDTYTDTVTTMNNRTVAYEVTAVDQFLNRSNTLELPALKIEHDGSYGKDFWTAETNMTSGDDEKPGTGDDNDPCAPEPVSAITKAIDGDTGTTYTGHAAEGEATVTLDFHQQLAVTAFKYTVTSGTPIESYEIALTSDGSQWQTVASGTFEVGEGEDPYEEPYTVYFPDEDGEPRVTTYDATGLRLTVKSPAGAEISISELDVLGPTGDNVELLEDGGIGILTDDFVYEESTGAKIPAGSLVFTGTYKGNLAYNVVLLYDQDGKVVGGVDADGSVVASQIILADVPEHGELGEVSDGHWVYWIEPDALEGMTTMPQTVRAELYRVDDALTNEGQRLTSDTLPVTLPDELPPITLESEN